MKPLAKSNESQLPSTDDIVEEATKAILKVKIETLNEEHFVSTEGSCTSVYREGFNHELKVAELTSMSFDAFKKLHAPERVDVVKGSDQRGNPITISKPLAPIWLEHPNRRTYVNGLGLFPNARTVPQGVYNLWRGWGCTPNVVANASSVKLALRHLYFVVCSRNKSAYRYLLRWMAWGVQNPEKQAEVAIVLTGGRGTGKSTIGRWMCDIFGAHGLQVTQSKHLTGNFNGHLRSTVFLFADEAVFSGDKAGNSVLKGLITEDRIAIEKKGVDVTPARNMLKIMIATNDSHAILAGEDERRYLVLEMSNRHKQDKEYFGKISAWWRAGGKEAMLGFLLKVDLGKFDIRSVPNTKALEDQKLQSLDPVDSWLLNVLLEGSWGVGSDWETEIRRSAVVFALDNYVKQHNLRHVKTSATSLGKRLRKLMTVTSGQLTSGKREKTWIFPDLDTARKQFANSLGLTHFDWDLT